ncbi:hypothetical protein Rin_00016900 [Candidatus Regiella insecticola 5.15]|uniref:Uncharacterized protein n=1 Tax=Candidatus Regiella insecticola 5.15 TaxID=1005043 RepID=G2H0V7_9ENTR|nr:hypothetical protein [Candidatus Regiella insecticola]EGY28374.1 hypothetical protein Rin_00016900 [Candidatus Regiella insecticola 5.15]
MVIHRREREKIHTRLVWKGGETTTLDIPVTVGSFSYLSAAKAMEEKIIELSQAGRNDQEIVEVLALNGFRSPRRLKVLEKHSQKYSSKTSYLSEEKSITSTLHTRVFNRFSGST